MRNRGEKEQMADKFHVLVKRRNENGEAIEVLEVTQKEFDKIISSYGTNTGYERKLTHFDEAFKQAQEAALPGEELKTENFARVDADGFEKTIVLLRHWTDMLQTVAFSKRKFRAVLSYDADSLKTNLAIYTVKES